MKLPKIEQPIVSILVPSIDKEINFRPFTVKEEKLLLMAQQDGTEKAMILAIRQVINNCCVDESFDTNSFATFDLEYIFLKLRSISVNNIIDVSYRDNEDNKVYNFEINLDEVELIRKDVSRIIPINETTGIKMKYPSVSIIDQAPESATMVETISYLIQNCIECFYNEDEVSLISEYTAEELQEWEDSLNVQVYSKIRDFFENLPRMQYTIKYTNSKGTERVIELSSLSDFFTLV